jgi:hypothetical protein
MTPGTLRLPLLVVSALAAPAGAAGWGGIAAGAFAAWADPPRGSSAWATGGWASLRLNDAFALVASGFVADHALEKRQPTDPGTLRATGFGAGLSYALDVVSPIVPFLELQVGELILRDVDREADPDLAITLGADWVFWRHGSLGLLARWDQPLPAGTGYFGAGPRLALLWP